VWFLDFRFLLAVMCPVTYSLLWSGQASHLQVWKFSPKNYNFLSGFTFGANKSHPIGSKNIWVKATYLSWVRSTLRSGRVTAVSGNIQENQVTLSLSDFKSSSPGWARFCFLTGSREGRSQKCHILLVRVFTKSLKWTQEKTGADRSIRLVHVTFKSSFQSKGFSIAYRRKTVLGLGSPSFEPEARPKNTIWAKSNFIPTWIFRRVAASNGSLTVGILQGPGPEWAASRAFSFRPRKVSQHECNFLRHIWFLFILKTHPRPEGKQQVYHRATGSLFFFKKR